MAADQRWQWLERHASGWQFGEQGIIDAVLIKIGDGESKFAEIGAGDGTEKLPLTCQRLLDRGWSAVLYEKCEQNRSALKKRHSPWVVRGEWVPLQGFTVSAWVVVIDVDSVDWLILVEVAKYKPGLIICEHADKANENCRDIYIPSSALAGTRHPIRGVLQATEGALEQLVAGSYTRIGSTRCNSIFVRDDLVDLLG